MSWQPRELPKGKGTPSVTSRSNHCAATPAPASAFSGGIGNGTTAVPPAVLSTVPIHVGATYSRSAGGAPGTGTPGPSTPASSTSSETPLGTRPLAFSENVVLPSCGTPVAPSNGVPKLVGDGTPENATDAAVGYHSSTRS